MAHMSPAGASLNGNLMYLYLPNGQDNVVKNNNFSSEKIVV